MNHQLYALERRLYAAKRACVARDHFAAARFTLHNIAAEQLLIPMSPADRKAARALFDVTLRNGRLVFVR